MKYFVKEEKAEGEPGFGVILHKMSSRHGVTVSANRKRPVSLELAPRKVASVLDWMQRSPAIGWRSCLDSQQELGLLFAADSVGILMESV